MHIPDGILPASISISGYAITGGVTWYSLRRINKEKNPQEKIPQASLLTAVFFVASLVHIPIVFTSIHLILNGVMGIILGYYAFPAILIGLFFQAVMFGHGGLSTLGINAVIMGIPALFAHHFFQLRKAISPKQQIWTGIWAFIAGGGALAMSASIFAFIVLTNISPDLDAQTEQKAIYISLAGYTIQAIIEGMFAAMLLSYLQRVKPEILKN
ncbi:MAG: cobalt transporter CbiM [Prochloraceae cyanobacterium]|nr:cobalt transporter CbiM [Prochloraceae cyanobacterium]